MRRLVVLIAAAMFVISCQKGAGSIAKYKGPLKDMEAVFSGLQEAEQSLGKMYLGELRLGVEGKSCGDIAGLEKLEKDLLDVRADLDRLKPSDMPMNTSTIQTGIDPATSQPILETTTTIDWGKVTGDSQKMWAYLHAFHTGLAAALKTAEVACQCIESGDKKSLACNIISVQISGARLNLDLESTKTSYLIPAKEMITPK